MITIFFAVLFVAVFGVSFSAYSYGFKRGRDTGWTEHYFESVLRDRARRDNEGKFKAHN